MKFVLNNSAVAFLAGQMFLSVVFLYVAMETRLSDIKAELTVINIRLDKLEEGQAELKKATAELKDDHRAIFKLYDQTDQRLLDVEVLALQNKKEFLLTKPQTADTRNQLAAVQEKLDYLDQLGRTRTYINPSEPYAPPTDG